MIQIVEKQRAYFKAGHTRCLAKRKVSKLPLGKDDTKYHDDKVTNVQESLATFRKMVEENGTEIAEAIYADLHRVSHFNTPH